MTNFKFRSAAKQMPPLVYPATAFHQRVSDKHHIHSMINGENYRVLKANFETYLLTYL
jgi:hypothetical protein